MLGAVGAFVGMSAVAGLLVTAAVTPAIAVTGMAANNSIGVFEGLPEYLEIGQLAQPTTIYASNGYPLATFYSQNRLPVGFDKMSQAVKDAAVAGEDPRFYSHGGVDIQGTVRGVLSTVSGGGVQGGSSITQQYVKNVLLQKCEAMPQKTKAEKATYQECVVDSTGVSPDRKVKEMKYAIGLEKKYSKDEILQGYLNIAGFGGSVYGIEAAAKYYYNTTAAALTPAQAASLVAIVNEPTSLKLDDPESKSNGKANGYAKNKERRDYILDKMYQYKKLTKAQHDLAIKTPIQPKITPSTRGCQTAGGAAYFCDYVQKIFLQDPAFGKDRDTRTANLNRGGYKIYTTLDVDLQKVAEDTLNDWMPKDYSQTVGGALVGVQPGTGRVLYMAQNKDYSQDPEVVATDPVRYTSVNFNTDSEYGGSSGFQPGSTYKVFTLAEWLKQGHSLYETVNARVQTYGGSNWPFTNSCTDSGGGPWKPTNDDFSNPGTMNALAATQGSVNTAFVGMAKQLDLCNIKKDAEAFGVHSAVPGKELGSTAASILGTNEIAPLTMATAFAGIANKGTVCTPIAIDKIVDGQGKAVAAPASKCSQAVDEKVAAAMAYALKRVVTGGTASGINDTNHDMLGKTGTSDDALHVWLVAATTKVAGAYWAGNIEGSTSMREISPAHGYTVATARNRVQESMMSAAASKYGGDPFPEVDGDLMRGVQVTVPDVSGKAPAEAKSILTGLGFDVQDGPQVDSAQPAGTVATTDPGAGSSIGKGSVITLNISNGSQVVVPDVVGKKLSDARATLSAAGFGVKVAGGNAPDAIVESMNPGANTPAKKGTQITLTVKKSAPATTTPQPGGQ
ncbi:transglycosylase domain-containing protein [Leifsonia sp. NPDC080035]|uniref:Transglycosylase domain-containing protein n=1 Tax=Leifsonia sp. NPDC080035 TaxID=3143936 RepID=A0AAU7G6B4_9MICO